MNYGNSAIGFGAICAVCIVALTNFEVSNIQAVGTMAVLGCAFRAMMVHVRRIERPK